LSELFTLRLNVHVESVDEFNKAIDGLMKILKEANGSLFTHGHIVLWASEETLLKTYPLVRTPRMEEATFMPGRFVFVIELVSRRPTELVELGSKVIELLRKANLLFTIH